MFPISLAIVPQVAVLGIVGIALVLFLRNRIRYDIVALLVMLAIIATGVMSYADVFANFGHPVVIIIASMYIMSEAFVRSGIVDIIVNRFTFLYTQPIIGLSFLIILVTFLSAFVNNAGALAMTIPIAIHLAKRSDTSIALFLLPLAFASHLGGFTTLIGSPRNILISDFRESVTGTPFAMFDFMYVGGAIAFVSVIFLITIAWRLIPVRKSAITNTTTPKTYTTEVQVPEQSKAVYMTIEKFEKTCKDTIKILSIHRENEQIEPVSSLEILKDDNLIISGKIDSLTQYTKRFNLNLSGLRAKEMFVTNEDDYTTTEAIVPPYTKIIGNTWNNIPLQKRFGTNFIGIYRRNSELTSKLGDTTLWPNDILLLSGRSTSINETISSLKLLPIANPEIAFGQNNSVLITISLIAGAIAIASFNIIPIAVIFLATSLLFILLKLVTLRQAYESIDQTVLILLAGMITLGDALQQSGAAESIAQFLLGLNSFITPIFMLIIVLVISIILSDFMNSMASAVVMAPIAILVATSMELSVDPFLIAVAVGSSCAFLTPIGHESNTMVMRQGGYTFYDYFKVGLPLEILVIITSVPLIIHFWPF